MQICQTTSTTRPPTTSTNRTGTVWLPVSWHAQNLLSCLNPCDNSWCWHVCQTTTTKCTTSSMIFSMLTSAKRFSFQSFWFVSTAPFTLMAHPFWRQDRSSPICTWFTKIRLKLSSRGNCFVLVSCQRDRGLEIFKYSSGWRVSTRTSQVLSWVVKN